MPTLTAISRDTATAGVTPFSVVLGGTGFQSGVVATFDGAERVTSYLSSSAIGFVLTAPDLATPGDHGIRAKNPDPTSGPSEVMLFHVFPQPPVPVLDSLSPAEVLAGTSGPLTVKAYGHGFVPGAVLKINGTSVTTTRVSDTLLQTQLSTGTMSTPGSITFTVYKQGPGGGTSAGRSFVMLPPPAITGTTPDSVEVGPGGIDLVIRGTGLTGSDSVRYFYQGLESGLHPATVTDTTVGFTLDRTGLASIGALTFSVHTPRGWSTSRTVQTYNPTPVITGITDTLDGSAAADTFLVHGTGFVPGMVVRVNGLDIQSTTVLGYDSIRAVVTEGALLIGGSPPVTVVDNWDGRTSAPYPVAIVSPAPTLDSIAPATRLAGVAGEHDVYGTNIRSAGEVLVNGVPRPLIYWSATGATFHVDSAEIAVAGSYAIAFRTPAPGGGTSAPLTLQVVTPNPVPVIDSIVPGVVRSDSGTQFVTVHGRGLIPGTTVELVGEYEWDPTDTLPILAGDTSFATVQIPPAALVTGRRLNLALRAPAPTVGPSAPATVPVWTTGVRGVTELAGLGTFSLVSDTTRGLVYGVTVDLNDQDETTTLVAHDPATGAVVRTLALPDHGARLYYDGASKYLYAVCASGLKVCRIDLDAWSLEWAIDAFTINGNITAPTFIAPQDAHPGTFALAVDMTGNGYANWVRVYDGTVPRAAFDTFYSGVHSGRFFGDTLVMMNGYNGYRRSVTPLAQSPLDSVPLALNLGVPGRILSSDRAVAGGHLMDLTTGSDLGAHPGFNTSALSTGPIAGRFYTALNDGGPPTLDLYAFDLDTGAELRHVGIEDLDIRAFAISSAGIPFIGDVVGIRLVESVLTDP